MTRTILFLELILPSVSTTICETFVCFELDDGRYLRAQFSLSCDSEEHRSWFAYAVVMAIVYLVLVPTLLLGTLAYHRHQIARLMTAVIAQKHWWKSSVL